MANSLLDFIADLESGSGGYDAVQGVEGMNLSGLTVGDAFDLANKYKNRKDSSGAIGRYQIIPDTLASLAQELKLDPKTPFTPELQDKLGEQLLKRRGLTDMMTGKIQPEQFAHNLSQEWAALPSGPNGKSFYDGVQGNKAGTGWEDLVSAVQGKNASRHVDPRMAGSTDNAGMPVPSGSPGQGRPQTGSPLQDPRLLAQLGFLPQTGTPGGQPQGQPPAPENQGLGGAIEGALSNPLTRMGLGMMTGVKNSPMAGMSKGLLVAQEAIDQQKNLNRELEAKQQKMGAGSDLPPNIQEMLLLKRMYPSMTDEDIMSMSFAGRVPQGGSKVEKIGERLYNVGYDKLGRPSYEPISESEQKDYEKTIGGQEKIKKVGETFGKAQVDTLIELSGNYQKTDGMLQQSQDLLNRFKSGEFDSATGPIRGRLNQFFDPNTAEIQAKEMEAALGNLGVENLAPVSNYEIDLIKKMYASSFATKDQNVAVLEDLVKVRKAKADALKRSLNRLKTESIEEFLQNPEKVEFEISDARTKEEKLAADPAAQAKKKADDSAIGKEVDALLGK